jgi:ribosomal subunit interface protein
MLIEVNTDNHIEGRQELSAYVTALLTDELNRFRERISRVEVHLGDENANKQGDNDKRCMIEARVEGLKAVAVTHYAGTIHQAIDGAKDKLQKSLDRAIGRLNDRNPNIKDILTEMS